jgi:hypothetical protein
MCGTEVWNDAARSVPIDLLLRIALLRDRMHLLYEERGGTDEAVLAVSVELDCALNEYQKFL